MNNNGKSHILVVDDDAITLKFCMEILSDAGYGVVGAQNGAQAVGILRSSFFHLVISDINMPGLNGIELYNAAIWDNSLLRNRFLFMTANLPDTLKSYMDEWGVKCLCKPFRISEFIDCAGLIISSAKARMAAEGRGTEQRQSMRFALMKRCVVRAPGTEQAIEFSAMAQDISSSGLRLVRREDAGVRGDSPSMDGPAAVEVAINGSKLNKPARIIWSRETGNMGLKFQEPMSAMDVRCIMPLRPLHAGRAHGQAAGIERT
ncbi:MAG: response regulator [Deltaproteobacteria bacterium]|nr:response regulator [Deltaproteobacteria bacterium]